MAGAVLPKLLALLAALLPLAGLAAYWEQAQQNPVAAAALSVGYEVLVGVGIFGKKVWAKLEDPAVDWCAAIIREKARRTVEGFRPGFEKHYRRALRIHHESLNVRGLGLINTFSLKLEQVFVDLRIAPSANPARPNLDPIAVRDLAGPRQIWEFLQSQAALGDGVALAIVGPPGSGKSTLLQHVALALAAYQHRRHGTRAYLPILLAIREHAAAIVADDSLPLSEIV